MIDPELKSQVRQLIEMNVSMENVTYREAGDKLLRAFGNGRAAVVDEVVADLKRESEQARVLDDPLGSRAADELSQAAWYAGPTEYDMKWNDLKAHMLAQSPQAVVEAVDTASTAVVGNLANPAIIGGKVQGLVLGHVQAGKTANYTAVAAKAADRGYKLVIVLAGIHNNLRDQTQLRLESDLGEARWTFLTKQSSDFDGKVGGANLLSNQGGVVIVIKKNATRLKILRNWLNQLGEPLLRRVPVLVVDDEADQATPNSATKKEEQTVINRLVTEIWASIVTGSYVGYTATPFANILIDPNDATQLYPRDFIVELPRSDDYFGAERIFGREPQDADDPGSDGLDMVRRITDIEASRLSPSTKNVQAAISVPDSLAEAIRWFVIATAIRRSRGQYEHSSMLVHTTHRVLPHFTLAESIREHLKDLADQNIDDVFKPTFETEVGKVQHPEFATPAWAEVAPRVQEVLEEVETLVDNGASFDRLNYQRTDEAGRPVIQTVIAVGGGTLSRGLTLEGLVVSYFARNSNTYDALLQMGRWFGYRVGYEDLPRVWVTKAMEEDFQFLALVEEEIRQEIRSMSRQRLTPGDLGVRIRQHVGRLSVTSPGKLQHAKVVDLSYNGVRQQTFILHENERSIQERNLEAVRRLVSRLPGSPDVGKRRQVHRGVPQQVVMDFIKEHRVHEDQTSINPELIERWLEKANPTGEWNVVLADNLTPGVPRVEVADGRTIGAFRRAPLEKVRGVANIKALLSDADWLADLSEAEIASLASTKGSGMDKRRASSLAGTGALIVMAIDKDSTADEARRLTGSRRNLEAAEHLIGYGLVFPYFRDLPEKNSGYISVVPMGETIPVGDDEESYEEGEQ
ncbi:Z1 domain-containing protein [Propionibacteriaceae bacterium Y1923]